MSAVEPDPPGPAGPIRPGPVRPLEGDDDLGDEKVLHFWGWALGDLRKNTARGFLAEYLVARALEDRAEARVEWAPHDATAADGTRVEVKATGAATVDRLGARRTDRHGLAAAVTWALGANEATARP